MAIRAKEKTRFGWRVVFLAIVSMGFMSCSTQQVPELDSEDLGSSWDAYNSCVQRMVEFNAEDQCRVMPTGNGQGRSYDTYDNVNYRFGNNAGYQPWVREEDPVYVPPQYFYDDPMMDPMMNDPYFAQIFSSGSQTMNAMTEHWKALAESGDPSRLPPWERNL